MGYGITIRVQGDYALFTRPEMKVERVSYDVITPSASRGLIEAFYWKPAIRWVIDKIHVLNEIQFVNIRRNEISEKSSASEAQNRMKGKNNTPFYIDSTDKRQQRAALVLRDVDYVIQAHFELVPDQCGAEDTVEKHYNVALRRLRKGQYFHAPYLGTREFGARVTVIEQDELPDSPIHGSVDLGWMLYDLDFRDPDDIRPMFFRAVMENGLIDLTKIDMRG